MIETGQSRKAAFGASLAVAIVVGILGFGALLGNGPRQSPDAIPGVELPGEPPMAGGREVSLAEAADHSSVPIYRPQNAIASDDEILDVWIRSGESSQVFIRYKSGVHLKVRPGGGLPSTEDWAKALIGDGIDGAVEDVAGIDAFVVQQHLEEASLGSVRFFLGDALVTIVGDGDFATSELRATAESIIALANVAQAEWQSAG